MYDFEKYLNEYPEIQFEDPAYPNVSNKPLALIFAPIESCVPFSLAIAKYLHEKYDEYSIIVFSKWSPGIASLPRLSPYIIDVLSIEDICAFEMPWARLVSTICAHAYGNHESTNVLLERFVKARFLVYADGFSNRVRAKKIHIKNIEGVIFFGFVYSENTLKVEAVLDPAEINAYYKNISAIYRIPDIGRQQVVEPESYSVVYLRYWGRDVYSFTIDQALKCVEDTITKSIAPTDTVIIKNDPRLPAGLYDGIVAKLRVSGFAVLPFDEYLRENGFAAQYQMLPVEYFFANGMLCRANSHVVFDSTIGFSLLSLSYISRPTVIVAGGDFSSLSLRDDYVVEPIGDHVEQEILRNQGEIEYSLEAAVERVRFNTVEFCNQISKPGAFGTGKIETLVDNTLFAVEISQPISSVPMSNGTDKTALIPKLSDVPLPDLFDFIELRRASNSRFLQTSSGAALKLVDTQAELANEQENARNKEKQAEAAIASLNKISQELLSIYNSRAWRLIQALRAVVKRFKKQPRK